MPAANLAGALLVVALVPGFAYLRLTERARRPRSHSALSELLEVIAVGVATTGVSALVLIGCRPSLLVAALGTADPQSEQGLRDIASLVAVLGGLALLIAWLLALVTRSLVKDTYALSVWGATLGLRAKDRHPFVRVEFKDPNADRIAGVLHSYTVLDTGQPRDIAILSPEITRAGQTWAPGPTHVVISAEQISKIWFELAPDPPGAEGKPRKRRRASSRAI